MAITHYLVYNSQQVQIEEPIGFDNLKVTFKRHEYHGISSEVSVGDLEFHGSAASVIREAYESDIDSTIDYIVMSSGITIYSGRVDLSTYREKTSKYHSVTCKVGDLGNKTTFNNRTTMDIDMNTDKTIDGVHIGGASWEGLDIPIKNLVHTNLLKQRVPMYVKEGEGVVNDCTVSGWQNRIKIFIDYATKNEYGNILTDPSGGGDAYSVGDASAIEEFRKEFGAGCVSDVDFKIIATITFAPVFNDGYTSSGIGVGFGIRGAGAEPSNVKDYTIQGREVSIIDSFESTITLSAETAFTPSIYIRVNWDEVQSLKYTLSIERDSRVLMKMADNVRTFQFNTKMLIMKDAISHIVRVIGENALPLVSDWYNAQKELNDYGGGALKYITNGYKIRGVESKEFTMSFSKLIDSLSALDCIGWGFSKENGNDAIRVERWDWFYDDVVVLELNGVSEVIREFDPDMAITGLNIGYAKYDTESDYYSIDSVHGERMYETGIKAISNTKSVKCEFIADNYAIEEARRAATSNGPDSSFKFDDNVFVFEASGKWNSLIQGAYRVIESTATNVVGLFRPTELINACLSPAQCAARWMDYVYATNSTLPLEFKTGKLNCDASFTVKQDEGTDMYLLSFMPNSNEKADIEYKHARFTSDKLSFDFPISIEQYDHIKEHPYGLVVVNGVAGWIKEVTYAVNTGMANFVLIPKFIE